MTSPTISRFNPPELGEPPGYSQIVEITAGRILFIAGQTAVDADGTSSARMILTPRSRKCSTTFPSRCWHADARPPIW